MAATDYSAVLSSLAPLSQSYTLRGNSAWYGRCPVCGSKSRTHLRLWIGESGRLHAKCYGGQCQAATRRLWFKELLAATGTEAKDWFPDGHKPRMSRIAATYDYRDGQGRLLFQCVKFAPGSVRKCSYRRPAYPHDEPAKVRKDAEGKEWVWDGAALDPDKLETGEIVPADPVLYRLPELLADDGRQPVLFPEGEKDVESLRALGFLAVTNPHGGGNLSFQMLLPLGGRRIVLFEDNDEAGRRHVQVAAGMLMAAGVTSLRIVHFRDWPAGHDVSDWLEQWPSPTARKSQLVQLVQNFPEWGQLTATESKARTAARLQSLPEAMARQAA